MREHEQVSIEELYRFKLDFMEELILYFLIKHKFRTEEELKSMFNNSQYREAVSETLRNLREKKLVDSAPVKIAKSIVNDDILNTYPPEAEIYMSLIDFDTLRKISRMNFDPEY
ncbi:MAG: hypothetical protein QW412_01630 [Candidatus Aenigmatarchaeota archaeon]